MPPKKKPEAEKSATKSLFDHINQIYEKQTKDYFSTLNDADKRSYSPYMVNRFLSMNIHQLPLVNEIQKYSIPPEAHYLFYATAVSRGRQFNKYIKSKSEGKYEQWMVELLAKHYGVSQDEAILYLDIYYLKNPAELRQICELYGIDPKTIKKAKL